MNYHIVFLKEQLQRFKDRIIAIVYHALSIVFHALAVIFVLFFVNIL